MRKSISLLSRELESHPDVSAFFHPEDALIDRDYYVEDYPLPEYYRYIYHLFFDLIVLNKIFAIESHWRWIRVDTYNSTAA
jgi:hypothetical protein